MRTLLAPDSRIPLVPFLNAHAAELSLLCEADFVLDLHYARRDASEAAPVAFPVETLSTQTGQMLRRLADMPEAAPAFVVAAPSGEAARLAELRRRHPRLSFLGLAQDVVPALVAGAGERLLSRPASAASAPRELVLVVRSTAADAGLVAEAMARLDLPPPRPHLSDSLIELFASSYRFDGEALIGRWLADAASGGTVATEVEVPLLQDFLDHCGTAVLARVLADRVALHPVFVDRADRLAAAVDALWPGPAAGQPVYDFHALARHVLSHAAQSAYLDGLRRLVPRHLDLVFEPDLTDPQRLALSLAGYLGVTPPGLDASAGAARRALPDAAAMAMRARLRAELHQ